MRPIADGQDGGESSPCVIPSSFRVSASAVPSVPDEDDAARGAGDRTRRKVSRRRASLGDARRGARESKARRDAPIGMRLDSADRFRRDLVQGALLTNLGSSRWGASVQLAPVVAPHTTEMALRRAAALLARLPSTSMQPQLAPAVFTRGMSGGLERFKEGQPVQTKRPAYDERDTPHTDKWLEVRPHDGSPPQLCTAFSDVSSSTSRTLWRGHRPGARSRASTPPNPRPPTNPHA